ncbi:MAG: hypothetical protein NTX59_14130 [Elusimicrobia bacterium]|nr:hypothetical protein [Elusimicrobiota bacterium]
MKNRMLAFAFIVWSAANYLAFFLNFLKSGNVAKGLHKLAGF